MTEKEWCSYTVFRLGHEVFIIDSSCGNGGKLTNRRRLRQSGLWNAATYRRLDLQKHLRGEERVASSLEEIIVNSNIGPLEKAMSRYP